MVLGAPNALSRTHHGRAGSPGHYRRLGCRSPTRPTGTLRHHFPAAPTVACTVCSRRTTTIVSARRPQSAAHRVTEVERPGALDHDGVLEHDVAADELAEIADAGTKQHWHLADAELVDEADLQRLLDDVGTGDRDELVACDFL